MSLRDIIANRKRKLELLKESGIDPYPPRAKRTLSTGEVLKKFLSYARSKKRVVTAGRLLGLRDQGGVVFADLEDETGKIQVVFKEDVTGEFDLVKKTLDAGDFVSVQGILFKTKKGERSVEARQVTVLAKSLRPVPSEWYGLQDTETRLRKRYLDFLLHPEERAMFERKAVFWESFRAFLKQEGFLEVEMPVLEEIPGGAEAEPFVTHHNALNEDFYLRISLELPLKKLLVGGFEKVFEIGRIFRNEGISREHLQDYTQLEFYWAYHDYRDLMKFVEKMYKYVIKRTYGTLVTEWNGRKINWGKKWKSVDYVEELKKRAKIDPLSASREELLAKAKEVGAEVHEGLNKGRLIDLIYKKTVRPFLVEPCFLVNPPVLIEPLAKRSPDNPLQVERMQVVACGTELGKGFTELNDPVDQRARFEEQAALREEGDTEAQMMNEDYVEAMEYGMPPAAGFGISERLFAMLEDRPVRETVTFPLMRHGEAEGGMQDLTRRIAIVVRDDIEPWQAMNAISHISAYIGNKMRERFDTGESFTSRDGIKHPRNTQYPVIVLKSGASDMASFVKRLRDSGLLYHGFIREMVETTNDEKIVEIVSGKDEANIEYLGAGVFGKNEEVKKLTKGFELWK